LKLGGRLMFCRGGRVGLKSNDKSLLNLGKFCIGGILGKFVEEYSLTLVRVVDVI
jgi:hypothetical protein